MDNSTKVLKEKKGVSRASKIIHSKGSWEQKTPIRTSISKARHSSNTSLHYFVDSAQFAFQQEWGKTNYPFSRFDIDHHYTFENPTIRELSEPKSAYLVTEQEVITKTNRDLGVFKGNWTLDESLDGIVLSFDDYTVTCSLLLDEDMNSFVHRSFDRALFGNIKNLGVDHLVIVTIMSRPGLSAIQVDDGMGIINSSPFIRKRKWEELSANSVSTPLDDNIKL